MAGVSPDDSNVLMLFRQSFYEKRHTAQLAYRFWWNKYPLCSKCCDSVMVIEQWHDWRLDWFCMNLSSPSMFVCRGMQNLPGKWSHHFYLISHLHQRLNCLCKNFSWKCNNYGIYITVFLSFVRAFFQSAFLTALPFSVPMIWLKD